MAFIERVRVPTLLFNSRDDPFVPAEVLRQAESLAVSNRSIELDITARGGHVGWIEGVVWPRRYYMESRIIEYLSL